MAGKRYYDPEQRTCWPLDEPRPDDKRILDDDTRTGNAAKDGYTAVGPRRPREALAGDIMDAEEAERYDSFYSGEDSFFIGY